MKFNDNTVNEASWEELLKESIGGRSNTSAYSLVYIDASKPEILLPAILEISGKSKYDISNLTTVKIEWGCDPVIVLFDINNIIFL